jgi:hypothetical protein
MPPKRSPMSESKSADPWASPRPLEPEPEPQPETHSTFKAAQRMGGLAKLCNKVGILVAMTTVRIPSHSTAARHLRRSLPARSRAHKPLTTGACSRRVGHVCVGAPGNRVGNPHAAAVDLWAAVRGKAHWLVRCLSRARVSARLWSTTEACATPTLRRRCKKSHPCIVDLFYRLFGTKIVMYGADPKAEPVYFIANHQHYHVSCLPGWLVRTRTSRRRRLRSHGCLFSSACAGQRDADLSHVRARSRRRRRWPPVDGQARPHGPAAGLVDVLQR